MAKENRSWDADGDGGASGFGAAAISKLMNLPKIIFGGLMGENLTGSIPFYPDHAAPAESPDHPTRNPGASQPQAVKEGIPGSTWGSCSLRADASNPISGRQPAPGPMNATFFHSIEAILHTERLDAYRQDGADHQRTLARYLLNMALSESLYAALQFSEIALRNAVHRELTARCGTDVWYDSPISQLTAWQQDKVTEAKDTLWTNRKPVTSGRIIAELTFGFWTSFFNNAHARTGIGAFLSRNVFPHAPRKEQYLSRLDRRWQDIRDLRNRVFHHERILHWRDLDARHQAILDILAWMSPALHDLAKALDRFASLRKAGLKPWLAKLGQHWPAASDSSTAASTPASVDAAPDADCGG